eukprot:TRINITY_DN14196_c0_g1_i2.p1 TRINITY_DN14196_c0_g1~~TRINITY_DN14196_c0_g1_i2.p1  ORF type:complete len:288 (+),score=38.92 TRINITY_DN14196_c0_g1_i2:56-919(+)
MYAESITTKERKTKSSSFTHNQTPNDMNVGYEEMLSQREAGLLRVFLKLSNINPRLDCYEKYRINDTDRLAYGHEECLILDGLWKPKPIPDDLYTATKYNNDLAWIIMSSKNTGSQLHFDPDHMGAWNLLLTGQKWWAIVPYEANVDDFTCISDCSHPDWEDGSNAYPWFQHILPQLKDTRFYGKKVIQFIQRPGEVLYLPNKMPHTILNLEDNVALTENYLFNDGLTELTRSISLDLIRNHLPEWNESLAYRILYNGMQVNSLDRKKMRMTYETMESISRKFDDVC